VKASFLCLLSRFGDWLCVEKSEISRLGHQISNAKKSVQLKNDNKTLSDQLAVLHSPVMLDQRARELNLGLSPRSRTDGVLVNGSAPLEKKIQPQQFAQRRQLS